MLRRIANLAFLRFRQTRRRGYVDLRKKLPT
jgi:hypothetical protein